MMKRLLRSVAFVLALCLCLVLATGSACAEDLAELSCGKMDFLLYQCTLQDGRLLLGGGTDRDENSGLAAWIMCLNTDRTVSWEYNGREDGYAAALYATVLQDGTVAVMMQDPDNKRSVVYFTPDGAEAREKLDLAGLQGSLYTVTPSFILSCESTETETGDPLYRTFLYDWDGKEITRYNGLVMQNGFGFLAADGDECVMYGSDMAPNSHGVIRKLDSSLDQALWETVLDWQLPRADSAKLDHLMKTADGGYAGWLMEGRPGEEEGAPYEWNTFLVKFDADGRQVWVKNITANGPELGPMFVYGDKIGVFCADSPRIDAFRYILWLGEDGTELETTEIRLDPEAFTVLRNYLQPETPGEKRTTILDQCQFIPMEDGLWTMATCWVANELGDEGFNTIFDSQEIVMFRIPMAE